VPRCLFSLSSHSQYCNPRTHEHPLNSHMSHTRPTSTSSSNFQVIFNNALKAYERRTKKDLLAHPLAAKLQSCNSPSSILTVLQQQVQELNQSQSSDERLTKWLDPTVKVLYTLSETLGEGVSLVCPVTSKCRDLHSHTYFSGILARESDLCRDRCPSFSVYPS
jgi:fungal STAND N-terminal Goodbye domain